MLIQYASDLHLELLPKGSDFTQLLIPNASLLILAGDIGNPYTKRWLKFLTWTVSMWSRVIYVTGNHEYYGHDFDETQDKIRTAASTIGFIYLEKNIYIHERIVFLGCTLWSHIPMATWFSAATYMNDYTLITYRGKLLTPRKSSHFFQESYTWLSETLKQYPGYICVVITHHAPAILQTSDPKYIGSELNVCFASDCAPLYPHSKIWIYGHTHFSNKFILGTTQFASNQKGYLGEGIPYNPAATIECETSLLTLDDI